MTDAEPFLRAICEHPDDDAPRLVFSDWLDERGEGELAEFIRLSCTYARSWNQRVKKRLRKQMSSLYGRHAVYFRDAYRDTSWSPWHALADDKSIIVETAWACYVNGDGRNYFEDTTIPTLRIDRGFVDTVGMTMADFLRDAESRFRRWPIRQVAIDGLRPYQTPFGQFRWFLGESAEVITGNSHVCSSIPSGLFNFVYPDWPPIQRSDQNWHFETESQANDALSRSCVQYGRKLAGLTNG